MIGHLGSLGRLGRLGGGAGAASVTVPMTVTTTTSSQTVTIGLAVATGKTAYIDWGDGSAWTAVTYNGQYQLYSHTYAVAGAYLGRIINAQVMTGIRVASTTVFAVDITRMKFLSYLQLASTGTSITGSITGMPLTYLQLVSTGTSITGSITGMPLTSLNLYGTGTSITGSITGMPLTSINIESTASITGLITGMALTYLVISGTGTALAGVLAAESRLTREYIDISTDLTLSDSRVYGTWGSGSMRIKMLTKLTATQTDATLIRLAAATISGGSRVVYISGAARTSASDAAYATLVAAGVTLTITG